MNDQQNSARFLRAFNGIEGHLRRLLAEDQYISFLSMLSRASERNRVVSRFRQDLVEFAELRNAIVHGKGGIARPIAEPHSDVTLQIEAILRMLTDPPKVYPKFQRAVTICAASDLIGGPARAMLQGDFSQLPTYSDGKFVGLLTAETIARWLAAQLIGGVGLVEERAVSEVMEFSEDAENYRFVNRETTVFEAMEVFNEFMARGKTLDAMLITQTGAKDQRPLGIVTIYDFPSLLTTASGS